MKCGEMKCADPEWRCHDCPRRTLPAKREADPEARCTWDDADGESTYSTGCDKLFMLDDGTPAENDMKFCPFCGLPLDVVIRRVCPGCKGAGGIDREDKEGNLAGWQDCTDCDGTGRVEGEAPVTGLRPRGGPLVGCERDTMDLDA